MICLAFGFGRFGQTAILQTHERSGKRFFQEMEASAPFVCD
jgi:hypothetical protein